MESEKLLERKFNRTIKSAGGWALKLLPGIISGLPDRIALLPGGVVVFAEIKTTGEKPRKIQTYVHKKIRNLGFKVYVIDTTKDILQIIKDYENR